MADSPYKPQNSPSQIVKGNVSTEAKKGKVKKGTDLRTGKK